MLSSRWTSEVFACLPGGGIFFEKQFVLIMHEAERKRLSFAEREVIIPLNPIVIKKSYIFWNIPHGMQVETGSVKSAGNM